MIKRCLNNALIGLGSNLGSPETQLGSAVQRLAEWGEVVAVSQYYRTTPLLHPLMPIYGQADFLNACVLLKTELKPQELMQRLQEIEIDLGRYRGRFELQWGPRAIDLDLLTYGDLILVEAGLVLPHPQMHKRRFVLEPLAEIAPEWRHPQLDKSARELLGDV